MLSIVVGTRHDGYGDRQVERLAAHTRSVDRFADALSLPVEHLIVEWAPLPGWAPVSEVLPAIGSPLVTRRIVHAEGPEVDAVNRASGRSFNQWAAKNTGVRRAAGRFVAVTCQDIVFLPELAEAVRAWMGSGRWRSTYARCDRVDITVAPDEPYPEIRCFSDAFPRLSGAHPRPDPVSVPRNSLQVALKSVSRPSQVGESLETSLFLPNPCRRPVNDYVQALRNLHTNAAGDFILALKDSLIESGGIAEGFPWHSHVDALQVCRLWGHGLGQVIFQLPAVVVHVDHLRSDVMSDWNPVPPQMELLIRGNTYPNQPATWGMAGAAFEETVTAGAALPLRRLGEAAAPENLAAPGPRRERPNLGALPLPEDMRVLLAELRVYRPDSPKIRLGRPFDGGYLLPSRALLEASRLVSIGVGGESSFEESWRVRTGKPVRMFDGGGPCPDICRWYPEREAAGVTYLQRHVGDGERQTPLTEALAGPTGAALKVDAGGAEYELLPGADLSDCAALVLAAHRLDDEAHRSRLADLLRQLNRDFVLVHLHGRNTGPAVPLPPELQLDGDGLPRELELTFVNRRLHLAPLEPDESPFPVPALDQRYDPLAPELRLRWVNGYEA